MLIPSSLSPHLRPQLLNILILCSPTPRRHRYFHSVCIHAKNFPKGSSTSEWGESHVNVGSDWVPRVERGSRFAARMLLRRELPQ